MVNGGKVKEYIQNVFLFLSSDGFVDVVHLLNAE